MYRYFLFGIATLFLPLTAQADVIINEIAWMGTETSANDEWIELFNNGEDVVDLSGWTIEALDGSPEIILSGTVFPQGFFILERSDDETLPTLFADMVYTGALSNSGEELILKDAEDNVVFTVAGKDEWPGGDNTTKDTLQWVSDSWTTGIPTPGKKNSSAQTSVVDEQEETETSQESPSQTGTSIHVHSASQKKATNEIFIGVSAGEDRVIPLGSKLYFEGHATDANNNLLQYGDYSWSFGDGARSEGRKVSHTYSYPGEYVVSLNVVANKKRAVATTRVSVFTPAVSISAVHEKKRGVFDIEITNDSEYDLNLSGWKLIGARSSSFSFPLDTLIKKGAKVVFPQHIVKVYIEDEVALVDPIGRVYSEFRIGEEITENEEGVREPTTPAVEETPPKEKEVEYKETLIEEPLVEEQTSFSSSQTALLYQSEDQPLIVQEEKSALVRIAEVPLKAFRFVRDLVF